MFDHSFASHTDTNTEVFKPLVIGLGTILVTFIPYLEVTLRLVLLSASLILTFWNLIDKYKKRKAKKEASLDIEGEDTQS